MSSRARHRVRERIVDHVPVDDVREPALEAAHRFHRGLAGGFLSVEVGASLGGVAQLDGGHHVQDAVALSATLGLIRLRQIAIQEAAVRP